MVITGMVSGSMMKVYGLDKVISGHGVGLEHLEDAVDFVFHHFFLDVDHA